MIDKDRVLRLNCPGFGEETHLNMGRAKTLENYQVIIANPVSLLHLFDKGPEPTRRINQLLAEGVNQLNVPDDALIQELINESDARLEELIPFLSQGGLLIYFLCRPFVLAGPTISVDNYDWLSVYAPAMKNPPENGSRQMSSVSHGRIIEPTEEGEQSEMAEYFTQQGVEWNTIIRTDFLSSNYSVMATAGSKKCIAAQFWAGDNGGKVVFLPAPYSPDFDRVLMNCVDKWYQEAVRQGTIQPSAYTPPAAKEDPAFHKPTGPDFYDGEQLETPPTLNELGTPPGPAPATAAEQALTAAAAAAAPATPAATVYAPPPLSSLLKFDGPPEAEAAPKSQPPRGALKSLLSDDDDDDDFSMDTPAPQAVKPSPSEALAKAVAAQAQTHEPAVDAEQPKTVEPEKAQVSNFELKKATAEMDLSQFAQTARQLVEQANVIESATRDPGKEAPKETPKPAPAPPSVPIPPNAAKQRIADLLKGLEFGKDDSDDLEPTTAKKGEDMVDVDIQPEKSSSLASGLKPNREAVSRNWLGASSSHAIEADAAELAPIDVSPLSPLGSTPAAPQMTPPSSAANISGMSTDEFRSTFEFLKGDDSPQDEDLFNKSKFQAEDVPEDKRALMAQAGLSADSLMNELSVMNELNALMEESEREAKAVTNDKEESPLQSLFKGESQDEKARDEEEEREKSLQSLMASLAQPAEPEAAFAEPAAAAPAEAAAPSIPTPPPAPILQTANSLMDDLLNQAARFDETKTAESAPSLKLSHEELVAPSTAPAAPPAMADEEEFSWAPKMPAAPAASTTPMPANPAPAASSPLMTPKPMPSPMAAPASLPATAAASTDSFDNIDAADLMSSLEASFGPPKEPAAKAEPAAKTDNTELADLALLAEIAARSSDKAAAAPSAPSAPPASSPRSAMAALTDLDDLDFDDMDSAGDLQALPTTAAAEAKQQWEKESLPEFAAEPVLETAKEPVLESEKEPAPAAALESAATSTKEAEKLPAFMAETASTSEAPALPSTAAAPSPLSAPMPAAETPAAVPLEAPLAPASSAWAPAASIPTPSSVPTAAEVSSAWAATPAPAAAAPPPTATPPNANWQQQAAPAYQHPAHPAPLQPIIPAPVTPSSEAAASLETAAFAAQPATIPTASSLSSPTAPSSTALGSALGTTSTDSASALDAVASTTNAPAVPAANPATSSSTDLPAANPAATPAPSPLAANPLTSQEMPALSPFAPPAAASASNPASAPQPLSPDPVNPAAVNPAVAPAPAIIPAAASDTSSPVAPTVPPAAGDSGLLSKLDLASVTPPQASAAVPDPLETSKIPAPHSATTNGGGDKSGLHTMPLNEPATSAENNPLSAAPNTPQPEELIRKMQQLTTTPAPSWCTDFSFPFIDQLRKEHAQLAEQVRQLQNAMNGMEARLETVETLKVALLTGEQEAFLSASQEILTRVGWQVQASRNDANELWLVRGERVEAIARVVRSSVGTNRTELAQLAQSVIAFWDKYETEPKGLLLAQNFAHQHPGERTEPDFAQALVDAAAKKSLCLMSSFQLLAMFKDGEMGQMTADEMRKRILETNGKLAGFALDSTAPQPATV